jgi:hypothetical protein
MAKSWDAEASREREHPWDPEREMIKVIQALQRAESFLSRYDELDAAMHLATEATPGPLTTAVRQGQESADRVASYLYAVREEASSYRRRTEGDPGE